MAMVIIKENEIPPMTEQEREQIRAAAQRPITYDEDCPESTPEMLAAFREAAKNRSRPVRA